MDGSLMLQCDIFPEIYRLHPRGSPTFLVCLHLSSTALSYSSKAIHDTRLTSSFSLHLVMLCVLQSLGKVAPNPFYFFFLPSSFCLSTPLVMVWTACTTHPRIYPINLTTSLYAPSLHSFSRLTNKSPRSLEKA